MTGYPTCEIRGCTNDGVWQELYGPYRYLCQDHTNRGGSPLTLLRAGEAAPLQEAP